MELATELFTRPAYPFQTFAPAEAKLRVQYQALESEGPDVLAQSLAADDVLRKSAIILELFCIGACTFEVVFPRLSELAQLKRADFETMGAEVKDLSGLDPAKVIHDAIQQFKPPTPEQPLTAFSLEAVIRTIRSFLEACPIEVIESIAICQELETWGHRCRVAYDGIQAFLLRNDPREDARIKIVGPQYVHGNLSVQEVAALLDIHPVDTVDLLERRGYSRPLAGITLDENERSRRLAELRADRLQRAGAPGEYSHERVARAVVASERIENVDARRWIPRESL